jgi:hypothetical protein
VPEFGRAGWSVGPRYVVVALPFFGWLAAAGLAIADPRPGFRTLAHALVLVGVVVYTVAATTYPHWPIAFTNPLYDVSFRLLGDGLAPRSLGTAVGLRGIPSLLPMYLAVAALCVVLFGTTRKRLITTAVALVLAAGIVWGYGRFPRSRYEEKIHFIEGEWEPSAS